MRKNARTHRHADMAWLTVAFPNFTNRPKMDFYGTLQNHGFQVFPFRCSKLVF